MEEMLKVSTICIGICLIITMIGQGSKAMSSVVIIATCTVLLSYGLKKGAYVVEQIRIIASASGIDNRLAAPVIKVLGISVCGRITAELCRDMGSRWAAGSIEIFAVVSSIICMLPLLEEVLRLVGSI